MENTASTQTVVSSEVEITGTVKSSGSIRIDGKLDGDLNCTGDATIGNSANIKGNMNVNSVSIAGTVNGNITAKDRIEMKSSARVMGDIKAKRLAVEDGVTFVGKSEVNPSGSAAAPAAGGSADETAAKKGEGKGEEGKAGLFGKK
jgi:cytoskeletal protein CcmA (bactofilin family)